MSNMVVKCAYIKLVPISDLKARFNPKNRNKHSPEQVQRIAQILAYQGIRSPVRISNRSGLLTAGHGRVLGAEYNGWTEYPVDFQDYDNAESEYQDMIADNEIARWAITDILEVQTDIEEFSADFDTDMLGIRDFKNPETEKLPQGDPDDCPEVPEEPNAKLGDIYQLGVHRLMCGDSTSIDAVETLMNGEKADMVFTDPPYGMKLDADYTKMPESPTGAKPRKWNNIKGDHEDFKPELIQTIFGIFHDCEDIVLCGADYFAELIPDKNRGSWFVWDKRVTENFDRMIGSAFELIWSKRKKKREIARINNTLYSGESDAINKIHPTQKPIKLLEFIFERFDGQSVVDLFGGSGSTLIACEKVKRKCFMMELDPRYIDVIIKRWEKYSGKTAILLNIQIEVESA